MLKVAGYCRVSSEESGRVGFSIEAQEGAIRKYCEAKGFKLVRVYSDAGISGFSDKRKGFRELMLSLELGLAEGVVVYKLDRFSRSLSDLLKYLDDFNKKRISFVSLTEQFDTTTAMGKLFYQVAGAFAELERNMTSDRMRLVFRMKFDKGWFVGKALVGYKFKRHDKRIVGVLVDEERASMVRDMFKLTLEGIGYKVICGKYHIFPQQYYDIVRNKAYAGYLSFEGVEKKGVFEPLVSLEDWERVQELVKPKPESELRVLVRQKKIMN